MMRLLWLIFTVFLLVFSFTTQAAEGVVYTVTISGVEDQTLKSALKKRSMLFSLKDKKPESVSGLRRRAGNDVKSLKAVLQEHGYFGTELKYTLEENDSAYDVRIEVTPGDVYTIGGFAVEWAEGKAPEIDALKKFELPIGKPALPETILETGQDIYTLLSSSGYPASRSLGQKIIVDHENKSVEVRLHLESGPRAYFGTVGIEGLKNVEEPYVLRRIAWKEGELFSLEKIALTRRKLSRTGLFSSVDIRYGDLDEENALPVTIALKEGKRRSVGVGAIYSTTQALLGQLFWEHRNIFGQAERLRLKAEGGTISYGLSADLRKPDLFGTEALSAQFAADYKAEEQEAFDRVALSLSSGINYGLTKHSSVSAALTLERGRVEEADSGDETLFSLASLPLSYRYDNSDDLLNPHEGYRLSVGLTPYDNLGEQEDFIKTDVTASYYWPVGGDFVWANRVRGSVIGGQSLDDIPADKRLYSGGGSSLRAYGYQLVGPLDENNNPTGGRLLVEMGTEGRYMITEAIEGVAFVGGGRVSEDIEFSGNEKFLWGGGIGARYHTAIGPLRVDIAVPFDKRPVDDAFQFYISIGQAF